MKIAAAAWLAIAAALALSSSPAGAEKIACAPDRAAAVARLAARYGEVPVGCGVSSYGELVEAFARPDGASWTLVVTLPHGLACALAAGGEWRRVARPAPPRRPGSGAHER